jgi:D-galactarolactone cycloisomerase
MKIAAIKTYVLSADLKTPFAYSQGWYDKRMALVVEVVSDEGLSGFGEVYGPPRPNRGVVEAYAPLLIGEDPFAIERHWQRLYNHLRDHGQRGLAIQALSGIDIALWDLKGRALGQPVHVLMAGRSATACAPMPPASTAATVPTTRPICARRPPLMRPQASRR